MIPSSYLRMEWFVKAFLSTGDTVSILDVGSLDLNGSFRSLFRDSRFTYLGLDVAPGPNVDYVPSRPYHWDELPTDSFDAVISGNVLEHVEFPWVTISEMSRVTKQGGLLCIIVPNGFREHRYPVDCWRFFTDGVIALARSARLEVLHAHTNAAPTSSHLDWFSFWGRAAETMLVARKPYSGTPSVLNYSDYEIDVPSHEAFLQDFVTYDSLTFYHKCRVLLSIINKLYIRK